MRTIPEGRFAQLIEAATKTFVARGYRQTQMSDVAECLGVAKGTLYGYVESKAALFDAAVRFADGQAEAPESSSLPLRTPEEGSTVRYIRERLLQEASKLELVAAISRPPSEDARRGEFASIIRDLYQRMVQHRRALKLVDRCAVDHPELAAVWFEEGRYGQVALLDCYIERGISAGHLRSVSNVALVARMVIETVALWAIHMPWDASPRRYAEVEVEQAVVDLIVHAYAKESGA